MPEGLNVCINFEFNLLRHVGVVAKRWRAAAETAHEGDNTPSGPTGLGVKMAEKFEMLDNGTSATRVKFVSVKKNQSMPESILAIVLTILNIQNAQYLSRTVHTRLQKRTICAHLLRFSSSFPERHQEFMAKKNCQN